MQTMCILFLKIVRGLGVFLKESDYGDRLQDSFRFCSKCDRAFHPFCFEGSGTGDMTCQVCEPIQQLVATEVVPGATDAPLERIDII